MTPGFGASLQAWPIHRVQPTCWYLATGTQARCHGYVRRPLSVLFEPKNIFLLAYLPFYLHRVICINLLVPHTPQQNEIAEKKKLGI